MSAIETIATRARIGASAYGKDQCPQPVGRPLPGFRASRATPASAAERLANDAEVESATVYGFGFLAARALVRLGTPLSSSIAASVRHANRRTTPSE
jgi:hypothetical protein